ncbi:MAG: putative DNA-binding domain-containing protein [Bacteroidia bacterium]|nr:putative DNA-binding domain-containing protein [Bacteroidia bacterium]
MLLKKYTYIQQSLLAKYTRTGNAELISKLKEVKTKGIQYYRHLIFNIVYDGIANAYPIMTDFFGEDKMKHFIEQFFSEHQCQNPQVWAMPKEFMDYFLHHQKEVIQQYPFLPDLMLFEWKEIELFMMPDEPMPHYTEQGRILKDKLILNPEIQILHVQYPVHLYHPKKIDVQQHKGSYFILIHRHPDTKDVLFTHLSLLSVKILEYLFEEPLTLNVLAEKLKLNSTKEHNKLRKFLVQGLEEKFILGFVK